MSAAVDRWDRLSAADRQLAERLDAALHDFPEVLAAYLYGSRAAGRSRADSDVDLALLLAPSAAAVPQFDRILRMAPPLVLAAGDRLDLVFLDSAPPLLAHRVLRDGILIHEKDAAARLRFHVAAVARYLDTQPMRELFVREAITRARERGRRGRPRDPREALGVLGAARKRS